MSYAHGAGHVLSTKDMADGISLKGYSRALRFVIPYWPRLVFVLLAGVAATGFGLLQPYISKLLIDDALLSAISACCWWSAD